MEENKREPLGPPRIAYVCDRQACAECNPFCSHTEDIEHAVNFEKIPDMIPISYFEKEERV